MADRIGAFRNIIPVTSRANDPPTPVVPPNEEEPGVRWSRTSTFKYDPKDYNIDVNDQRKKSSGLTVIDSPKHRYETRVETLAAPAMYKTRNYEAKAGDIVLIPLETWEEMWFLFLTENQQVIVGSIDHGNGNVTELYQEQEVEYWIHMHFTKRPATPRLTTGTQRYGSIP